MIFMSSMNMCVKDQHGKIIEKGNDVVAVCHVFVVIDVVVAAVFDVAVVDAVVVVMVVVNYVLIAIIN